MKSIYSVWILTIGITVRMRLCGRRGGQKMRGTEERLQGEKRTGKVQFVRNYVQG